MTLNEYIKLHPPSIITTSLIKELKQYSQEDDYIIGILLDCESDAEKQYLLDYIRQGKDVNYESIILCALEIAQNTMIDSIKQYDNVILKDGRKALIVEILGDKEAFIADIDIGDDYETETIYPDEIDDKVNDKKVKRPKCPKCGSNNVAYILYGRVRLGESVEQDRPKNEVVLGGCFLEKFSERWKCNDCQNKFGVSILPHLRYLNIKKHDYITAHVHSFSNKNEIKKSNYCGCFYCLSIFKASRIKEWVDDVGNEDTAICPFCGIDSVIGDNSGFEITEKQLKQMHKYWFEPK